MIFKSEIVFVKLLFPFSLGIILAYHFQDQQLLRILQYVLPSLIGFAILIHSYYKKLKGWNFKKTIASFYYLLFFCLGIYLSLAHTDFLRPDYFANKNYPHLKGWINSEPQQNNQILRFELAINEGFINQKTERCSGKLLIALKLDSLTPIKLNYGDELIISANYLPVEPPYNPAEFNFKQWLAAKNIYHQSFIKQEQLIKTNQDQGNRLVKYALTLRQELVNIYRNLIHNNEAFAVASTLILGYRADLSKETLAAYSKTGTIHALSVSGMHVGLIYIMLNWCLVFLNRKKFGRILKTLIICSLIWYYSLLTGFSPSVLRSAIMITVFIFAKQLNRGNNSYNVLAFTAFILLVFNPFLIWDVGFQLSFLAVFGLIYFQPKIYKWFYFKHIWTDKLWSTIAMSLAAQLATLPLSIYYFHQFPIYFIISNLFILIPITLLMYSGIAILVLHVYFVAPAFEWLINFTNNGLKWIAELPYAGITEIWLNQWQLILLFLLITMLSVGLSNYKKNYLFFGFFVWLILQSSLSFQKVISTKQSETIFFSLRKNYAAAFIEGNNCLLVTDLTINNRNFEFFIKPALDQKHINSIKFVKWEEEFSAPNFIKKGKQLISQGKCFLLMDETFNDRKIINKLSFDFIWMHNTPKQNIELLSKEINFKALIMDASNKDYLISKFELQANLLNLPIHILKKQPAITLNQK